MWKNLRGGAPKLTIFSILPLLFLCLADAAPQCPPPNEVSPCECSIETNYPGHGTMVSVVCSDKKIDEIYGVIDTLSKNNYQVDIFKFSSTDAMLLRYRLFKSLKLTIIEISAPKLTSCSYFSLESQRYTAESVAIKSSNLSQIPVALVTSFDLLEEFTVSGSKNIEVIEEDIFEPVSGKYRIKKISFTFNSIKVIQKHAFYSIKNVEIIDLTNNQIATISSESMPHMTHLKNLKQFILWDNKLTTVPSDILKNMAENSTLGLFNNQIVNISPDDVEIMIKKHMKVKLGSNNLNCNCAFLSLALAYEEGSVKIVSGTCASPADLKNFHLTDLTSDLFPNC